MTIWKTESSAIRWFDRVEPKVPLSRNTHRVAGIACGLCAFLIVGCSSDPPSEIQQIRPTLQEGSDFASNDLARVPVGSSGVTPLVLGTLRTRADIAEAAQKVEAGIVGIDEARAGYYPQLSAGVISGLAGNTENGSRLQVTASQLLYDFGGTARAVSREVLASQGKYMRFLEVVDEELAETVKTYWTMRRYVEQQAIADKQLQTMQQLEKLSQSRSNEGVNSTTDLLEAQRRVQSAETILLQAQLEMANANRRLSRFSGVSGGIADDALGTINLTCEGEKFNDALSPRVQLAALQKAIAEIDLKDAENALFPSVSLEAVADRDIVGSGASGVGVNLKVDSALFSGGAHRSRKVIAVKTAKAADAALEAARQDITLEHDNAIADIKGQRVLIASLEKQADMLDETRELYRRQFVELGNRTIEDVLDIEDEYFRSLRDLAETRINLAVRQVDCVKSSGRLRARLGLDGKFLHGLALSP
ncbi:TolC family protein [Pelagivirga sediminicola]|uniref:TolC family protein n=1 Tax=Pelagivirga sediminicola TaxID=2170575 RepID=UPI0014028E16|nr:TolC family protein [Pelagivirga sediminicola]